MRRHRRRAALVSGPAAPRRHRVRPHPPAAQGPARREPPGLAHLRRHPLRADEREGRRRDARHALALGRHHARRVVLGHPRGVAVRRHRRRSGRPAVHRRRPGNRRGGGLRRRGARRAAGVAARPPRRVARRARPPASRRARPHGHLHLGRVVVRGGAGGRRHAHGRRDRRGLRPRGQGGHPIPAAPRPCSASRSARR